MYQSTVSLKEARAQYAQTFTEGVYQPINPVLFFFLFSSHSLTHLLLIA
jgi:hypothetical protein